MAEVEEGTSGGAPVDEEVPLSALGLLRTRDFGVYFVGNSLSNIGTWFQNLAAAILVFRLTRSTLLVGVVNFAQLIGAFVLAPWAGAAADRFDRRRLLIVTQVVAASVSAMLALVTARGAATAPIVIASAALLGLALAFMVPSLLAMVPLLVRRRDLDTAISLNSVTFNLARGIGPVLAALVIGAFGLAPAFAVNAASFGLFILALLVIRPRPQALVTGPRPQFRDTIGMVRRDPVLRTLLLVVMTVSVTTDPVNTLTPEFATEVLGRSDTVTGWLVGAFGGGATIAALTLTGWLRRRRHGLVEAMVVEALGILAFAVAPNLPLALAGLAVAGAGFIGAITRSTTRIQREVPDDQLGRVMALWSLAFVGMRPFAALLDGAVAELLGVRPAAALMSLPVLAGAVLVVRVNRRFAMERAAGEAPAEPSG
jgi:MFS family permease